MITLQRPDQKFSAFLGERKGINDGDAVRPSQFAMAMHLGERKVIYNMLTGHVIESKYFDWFENPEERTFDASDIEMTALVKRDFLVAPGLNEAERYVKILKILRRVEMPKPGYTGYTILPTTACNARCVYCYEEGIPYETMTDEMVDQTIKYILATRREDAGVSFHWFGGEPLMGEKVIDRICAAMRDADIKYSSNMISNGSLMTEELAKKAKDDWHLTSIQITLDGREEMYCDRKRYVNYPGSPYRAVLDGIHALIGQGIRVSIRLNVDEDNADEMMALADELEAEFSEDSLVSVYSHSIFAEEDDSSDKDDDLLYSKLATLNERLNEFNLNRSKKAKEGEEVSQDPVDDSNIQWETDEDRCPDDESVNDADKAADNKDADDKDADDKDADAEKRYYDRRGYTRRYYCMVDSPMAGGVILPNGDICLCEHIGEIPVVGNIRNEAPFDRNAYIERGREKTENCRGCALLPMCTDFMSCPTCDRDCVRERMEMEKRGLRRFETEDRLPPVTIKADDRIVRVTEPTREFAEKCTAILADDYLKVEETISQEEAETLKKCTF